MTPINNNLRKLRKQKGLTQWEVAHSLGFHSTDRISKWEKGTLWLHMRNAILLAKLYGVHAEELYTTSSDS